MASRGAALARLWRSRRAADGRGAVWNVYEQVFVAALDLHDDALAVVRLARWRRPTPS